MKIRFQSWTPGGPPARFEAETFSAARSRAAALGHSALWCEEDGQTERLLDGAWMVTVPGCARCRAAQAAILARGLTPAFGAAHHGHEWCAAGSVEIDGPATLGAPRAWVKVPRAEGRAS